MEKAVIFDLDGTLWDTSARLTEVWNGFFRQRGYAARVTQADIRRFMGTPMAEIGAALFPDRSPEEAADIMADCGKEEVRTLRRTGGALYDGVEETLDALRQSYRLMLVSNCQAGYAQTFLYAHHLGPYFCETAESGGTGLPKAENIRLVMARRGVSRAVYVGDTRRDEDAARTADVPFIHAAYGFGTAAAPDGVISRLAELPSVAASLLGGT